MTLGTIGVANKKFETNFLKNPYEGGGGHGFNLTSRSARIGDGNHHFRKASLKEVVRRQGSLIC